MLTARVLALLPPHDGPKVIYAAAKMDRDMGELWAELSDGKCRFVMATDKKWGGIEEKLK